MAAKNDLDDIESGLFSDVVASASSKEKKEKEKRKANDIDEGGDGEEEHRRITITISPRTVERTIFVFIILVLLGFFFYNPFQQYFPWNGGNQITGAAVADDNVGEDDDSTADTPTKEGNVKKTGNNDAKDDDEEDNNAGDSDTNDDTSGESSDDADDDADDEDTLIVSGEVTFTIDDYEYDEKEWGIMMKTVSFTIENQAQAFTPKVRAYVFDEETRQTYEQAPEIKLYQELGTGKRLKATINAQKFTFANKASEKTIRLKLYDEGSEPGYAKDKHVKTVEKKFTPK
ncbi:hypothetical protein HYS47_04365 [Candidatus Woesearchaeota archaeon]|nr:hypothetical protein [Candidatus Woesearchaeota archaeon]